MLRYFLIATMLVFVDSAGAGELMLDGDCRDHNTPQTETYEIDNEATLHVTQSREHVWFCYTLVDSHGGVLDLYVDAPGMNKPL